MIVSRHISLDDEHVEKIKPYLVAHKGNFGAAIREMIQQAGKRSSRIKSSAVETSLFNWMLEEVRDTLVPDDILDELIDPALMKSMSKLEAYINRKIGELEWDISLELKHDSDIYPSSVSIGMAGAPQKIKFLACVLAQYMVKNSLDRAPLEIKSVVSFSDCIKVELSRSDKKEAQKSLASFFGGMDEVLKAIKNNPAFWKAIIRRHLLSNYNMVTLERNYFEDVLAGKIPSGEMIIENLAKKPLQEIPLKEMLGLIKEVYETSRVVDRVEIDNDTVVLLHNYRNEESVKKLKKSLVALLEANGHLYDAKSAANMVVLTHRPDVGTKINEIVNNLKLSDNRVDQELVMFMAFLSGLKDIPDIPISLTALGRRIGRSLMQEYEKENNIKGWDPETFQKALQMVDSRLHRDSEWKLDGKNLLYRVRKCNIATEGDTFDTYICHIARETFKGALGYAFGNKAELSIKHLLTHGDSFCEVIIRMP